MDFHPGCARRFFGSETVPQLPYTRDNMSELAKQVIRTSASVTGVQAKMSLDVDRGGKNEPSKFTIVGLWGKYIFKPQSAKYPNLPELEDLTMKMAEVAHIRTARHTLIRLADGELGYLTLRMDRGKKGEKISMLDMCQLTNRLTEHKYYGTYQQLAETIKRSEQDVNNVLGTVSEILENVRVNKDHAIREYTEKFDGVLVENLKVSKDEIKEAYWTLDDELLAALKNAADNIRRFHEKQIPSEWTMEVNPGIVAGQIVRPINSAGCYIPGGRAAYPSSILMTVIPAKIAGVEKVVCVTPPQKDGRILDAILVAADIAGADEIYKVGGAQAIAALAYGTESVPRVEKIVGPGNIFVTAAKKLVYGQVDIEFPAGPSEVLILADDSANPEFLATDILAQAEHDPNASCFLVTDSEELALRTDEYVKELTEVAPRREIIEEYKKICASIKAEHEQNMSRLSDADEKKDEKYVYKNKLLNQEMS